MAKKQANTRNGGKINKSKLKKTGIFFLQLTFSAPLRMTYKVAQEKYAKVVKCASNGNMSEREIESKTGIPRSTVGYYLRKWRSSVAVSEIRGQGLLHL